MSQIVVALLATLVITGSALADECKDNAKDKNGKQLAGAALTQWALRAR
jgi:hypothetical protein